MGVSFRTLFYFKANHQFRLREKSQRVGLFRGAENLGGDRNLEGVLLLLLRSSPIKNMKDTRKTIKLPVEIIVELPSQ